MVKLLELVQYCDTLLDSARFQDYCPNGLQVEGRPEVGCLVSGVTASQALIEAALERGADALLVHHGYFWRGEAAPVVGIRKRRLQRLLGADLSLIAYHLPLDAHPELGNNAQLAQRLGIEITGSHSRGPGAGLVMHGRLPAPLPAEALAARLQHALGRAPLHVAGGTHPVQTLAWCSGAAQGYIEEALALGVDAYVSGEVSESTVHVAREGGIHFYGAGHHATERYGVMALGEHLARRFGLAHEFVDIDNPV